MPPESKSSGAPPSPSVVAEGSASLSASTIDLPPEIGPGRADAPPPSVRVDPYLGTTIDGRYVVERLLGEGGMGVVYAGRHKVIAKRVAIKVLRHDMAADQEVNERFLQEARAASAIGNPHIIDISDFGQLPDGSTYFVMELLEGKGLGETLVEAKGPLPAPRLCHVAKQIAQALAAAHAANIVHRDLKPDNVMLVPRGGEHDFVKILDFGIAKVGSGTKRMTRAGSVFGTPHYMSPEQAAGAAVDHRTDIYSLGVILYEMASGKVPFDADNFMGILTQHMYKAPVPIRALVPEIDVPPGLDAIVLKCLTKKPEGRYATMDGLIADLDKLDRGLLPDAVEEMMARSGGFNVPADYFRSPMPAPVPASPIATAKRWPLVALIGAVGTVVGVVAVGTIVRTGTGKAQPAIARSAGSIGIAGGDLPAAAGAPLASAPSVELVRSVGTASVTVPAKREVLVSVVPTDATISRDGTVLGQPPLALHLAPGELATLTIERKGYKSRTATIGPDEPKATFILESAASPAPRARAPGSKASGDVPSGGIDDVGDPFAGKH